MRSESTSRAETARRASELREKRRLEKSKEESEAMADLARIDEAMYVEYKKKTKRPTDAMELAIQKTDRAGNGTKRC
jgi:hypothetical protein